MNFFYPLIFILGACIGSFLNVVILRLHANKKFIKSRSECPNCKYKLKWYDNIPILSFIILRGKCRKCSKKISLQYPLVELATSILFLLAFFNVFNSVFVFSCFLVFVILFYFITISFLIIIFVYDLKYYLIPDKISIPAIIVIFVFQALILLIKNNFNFSLFLTPYFLLLFSAIIISGFFALQFLISKGKWIGGGDIRLGFLMGIILGWPMGLVALFLAYILGSLYAIPAVAFGKKKMKSQIPFGTFLSASTLIAMLWGEKILNWYMSLL